jgi:hypothetical protein
MTVLHPWAIAAGAAAVTLPVIIHWLTKPRPVRLPLSTVRFVLEAVQQRRARLRLRDLLILLLRVAAVALVALAFARPFSRASTPLAADAGADTVRVVILDQSASMGAASGGIASIDRAKPVAAKWLAGSGARGALILAAAQARTTFDRPSSNWGALRDEAASAAALPERLNLSAAINLAGELLGRGGEGVKRELVVVSDFQRSNWASADFSALPKDTAIHLESVAPKQTPANVGILAVRGQGRVEQGRELRLEVDVGNYSPAARDVNVEVRVGDATSRLSGLCPAGQVTTLSTPLVPAAAGWQSGEARLLGVEDALAIDNVRPFVLEVKAASTYLLVTRDPSRPSLTSSHLLERALAPSSAARDSSAPRERVVRVAPDSLDREAVSAADLVVVEHPGPLSQSGVALLVGELRRGKPLWYVAAEPVDATNLKLLVDNAGSDLKMPVEFYPPPAGQVRKGLFLTDVKTNRPPFAVFGDALGVATGPLRFSGGLGSRPAPQGSGALADDVLAAYSDRSACLVSTTCGAGLLAVLNADLNASTLPRSAVFVPMVGELVSQLLGHRGVDAAISCGEPTARVLPATAGKAQGLSIVRTTRSDENADAGTLSEDQNAVVWKWPHPAAPAVYQVRRAGIPVYAAATALPAEESDLTSIDSSVLTGRLTGGRLVNFRPAAGDDSDDSRTRDRAWAWLLCGCAACMIVELGVLRAFKT